MMVGEKLQAMQQIQAFQNAGGISDSRFRKSAGAGGTAVAGVGRRSWTSRMSRGSRGSRRAVVGAAGLASLPLVVLRHLAVVLLPDLLLLLLALRTLQLLLSSFLAILPLPVELALGLPVALVALAVKRVGGAVTRAFDHVALGDARHLVNGLALGTGGVIVSESMGREWAQSAAELETGPYQ